MKVTSNFPLKVCDDCESEHIGGNCGMTAAERFRTVKLGDTSWMPAKMGLRELDAQRQDGKAKGYYDDEALKLMFNDGLTGKERREELMEDTQGVGFATPEDIQKHPELVAAHFLDNPKDEIDGA